MAKILAESKEIWLNWGALEDFYICFWAKSECYWQKFSFKEGATEMYLGPSQALWYFFTIMIYSIYPLADFAKSSVIIVDKGLNTRLDWTLARMSSNPVLRFS